jgi:hypothetical protein
VSTTGGAGNESDLSSVASRSLVTDALLERFGSSDDTRQLANDILRLWDSVRVTAEMIAQREAELRAFFASHPAKSDAEILSDKIVEFATSLDKLSQSQRKNIESLIELTTVATNLLKTVDGFQKHAESAVADVRDAAKDELARAASKLRMPKILSVGEMLGLHITTIVLLAAILAAVLLRH